MYFAPKKHNPPHVHVYYQDEKASINIENGEIFNTVKKSFDTIQWNNEADFDPDILYEKSTPYITK